LYDVVEAWKKAIHANIVPLREVFLTKDFEDEQHCKNRNQTIESNLFLFSF